MLSPKLFFSKGDYTLGFVSIYFWDLSFFYFSDIFSLFGRGLVYNFVWTKHQEPHSCHKLSLHWNFKVHNIMILCPRLSFFFLSTSLVMIQIPEGIILKKKKIIKKKYSIRKTQPTEFDDAFWPKIFMKNNVYRKMFNLELLCYALTW